MNANDVIEAYVQDVARLLPRRRRADVAFELRTLLAEELDGKAEAAGRAADAAMATELANAFGRPADVAARYQPTLVVIDPADGTVFMRLMVVGLVIIWTLGLMAAFGPVLENGEHVLNALARWWTQTVLGSLWWPGVLVVYFAFAGWMRRVAPKSAAWTPRDPQRIGGGRTTLLLGIAGIAAGVAVLADPRAWLVWVSAGQIAPVALEAFIYAEPFHSRQGPLLLALLALNIPLLLAVMVRGRWSPRLRTLQDALGLVSCVVMAWIVLDGPVLTAAVSNSIAKAAMVLSIAFAVIEFGVRRWQRVRPAPMSAGNA